MRLWYKTGDVTALQELPQQTVVCLDVETTGLDPRADEVLQLAVVRGDGKVLEDRLLRPEHTTSWSHAQSTHGISPDVVRDCPTLVDVAPEVESALRGTHLIVGYNILFDLAFLKASGIRWDEVPLFDVMREYAPVEGRWDAARGSYAWVPLARCAARYGCRFRRHRALEDARAALHCFWAMLSPHSAMEPPGTTYLDIVARYARSIEVRGAQSARR